MARILLHTLVFSPDCVATSYLMTDLARQLRDLGHEITVLTTTPHYNLEPSALSRQPLRQVWPRLLYESGCGGIRVWHVAMPLKGERVSSRLLDYLRFHVLSLLVGLFKLGPYDVVLAPSPPLTIGIAAWLLALRRWAPSIYNLQELYPDFAIHQGLVRNRLAIRLMRVLERLVYTLSSAVVPVSESYCAIIEPRGAPARKLCVIPNFVDTLLYQPGPRDNPFAVRHRLLDDFVVLYGGNVGLGQDWDSFLHAAYALRHLPIQFVLAGDGVRLRWLEDEARIRGLTNVKLLGYQPRELMPEINASCDVGTIPMKANANRDTLPSKVYTIMACARPVIAQAEPDSGLSRLLEEARCGRVTPPDDAQAYTDAVLKAFQERHLLAAEGERGRAFIEQRYSKETVARQYDGLIRQLLQA